MLRALSTISSRTSVMAVLSLAAALFTGIAQAQTAGQGGAYAGVGLGLSDYEEGCPLAPGVCPKSDTAFRFFSGWQFTRHLGAEFGFVSLGEIARGATRFEAAGAELVGIARWPLTRNLVVFGKAGGFLLTAKARPTPSMGTVSYNEHSRDLTYGVGLSWGMTANYWARFEWQRYLDVGEDRTTGQTDIDYAGISVLYAF